MKQNKYKYFYQVYFIKRFLSSIIKFPNITLLFLFPIRKIYRKLEEIIIKKCHQPLNYKQDSLLPILVHFYPVYP